MHKLEVLVHITAPSQFSDDKRYRAQADAIARFEPATVTCIYGGSREPDQAFQESRADENTNFTTILDGPIDIVKETPEQPRTGHLLSEIADWPPSSAPSSASPARWRITKDDGTNIQQSERVQIPPNKNPLLNRQFEQSTIQAVRTPDHPRPKTAPAGETGLVDNAFAGWTTRRRTRSESSSFESFLSVVPETQQVSKASMADNTSGSPTQYFCSSENQDLFIAKHTREADDKGANRKKPRLEEAWPLEKDVPSDSPGVQIRYQMQPFFLRDRSLDWTSSPAPSSSDMTKSTTTATATATPSHPLPEMSPQSPPPSTPKAKDTYQYQNPTSPINLISQDLQSSPQDPAEQLPQIPSPPSPPAPPSSPPSSPPFLTAIPRSLISSLPNSIFPPPPPTGHGSYITHITPVLAISVKRLPIAKWFRPVHVSRDVRVLERGHWRIPITIASKAVVDEARAETPRDQKLAKITKQCDAPTSKERWEKQRVLETERKKRRRMGLSSSPLEYGEDGKFVERKRQDLWTEEEFVGFWTNLEECVGQGKWGWGIRVLREELDAEDDDADQSMDRVLLASPPSGAVRSEGAKGRRVLLKVTTWGEVIAHIWILLWLMSDKLIAYIPMEWRAGDGSVVVKMSGYRRKHGVLGEWVYKGPAGERGIWGIAEAKTDEDASAGKP